MYKMYLDLFDDSSHLLFKHLANVYSVRSTKQ